MKSHKQRAKELVSQMTLAEKIAQMKHNAPEIERLGIPAYNWWNECIHGVGRSGVATVFPQPIGMAASFNADLLHKVANAISDEARAKYNEYKQFGRTLIYQGLTFWSPNINIFRDPRWGRGHETYGEDPYLTARMGAEFIQGLQGTDKNYRKIDATIKHYAVHSGPESMRHSFDVSVSKKDLYETYLYAFRYCIEKASPSAVMGAYNCVDGEPCCASEKLLKNILYGEFSFDGYVVSDCGAICDIHKYHKITQNPAESAAIAVNNGCQLNCGETYKFLKTAVAMGLVSEETITQAAERLFETRFRLGMFDEDCVYDNISYDVVECEKHCELNLEIAREGIVLLKNDGILPLGRNKKIAVIGPNADSKEVLLGNYNGTPSRYTTFLRGIQEENKEKVYYAKGCHSFDETVSDWAEKPLHEALIAAKHSDVVIMIMGLNPSMEGEEGDAYNGDSSGDKLTLNLPIPQRELYEEIKKTGKPIIFVNVSGSAINLSDQKETAGAVIQCFYPGAMGGRALSDVIFGNVSPSGRLPVTFYKSIEDLPPFEDYAMENRTYKYFIGEPLYPFGYGLSYTNFVYTGISVSQDSISREEGLRITVTVKNTGTRNGKEAVQIYLKTLQNHHPKLVGFKKIELKKGDSMAVDFYLGFDELAIVGEDGRSVIEPGEYTVYAGGGQPRYFESVSRNFIIR